MLMKVEGFIEQVKKGTRVSFKETMAVVEENYIYTPARFFNGLGEKPVENAPGANEGSCKIFALGKLFGLSREETVSLFGELYWKDVVENPDGTDHANIRTFLRDGWEGIRFESEPLEPRDA
jgi:hypothetical protein